METLEKMISQEVQSLLWHKLEHNPTDINCKLYNSKIVILIENALTKPERLLISNGYEEIAQKIRQSIEEILHPQLKMIIENVTDTSVNNLLFATHVDSNYISLIAILDRETRNEVSNINVI